MKRNVFAWRISQFAGTQRHTTAKLREATITHASQASFSVGIPLTVNRVYRRFPNTPVTRRSVNVVKPPWLPKARSVVYGQGRSTIFRMPIYPMLNQWNANPMTPNPGLWLVESTEASYEYWWEHISYAYLSNVKIMYIDELNIFVPGQATPSAF